MKQETSPVLIALRLRACLTVAFFILCVNMSIVGALTYTGLHSPSSWKNAYPLCAAARQSPIDIKEAFIVKGVPEAAFFNVWSKTEESEQAVFVVENDVSPMVYAKPSNIHMITSLNQQELVLDYVLIRSPSEHRINGEIYDMEMQFKYHPVGVYSDADYVMFAKLFRSTNATTSTYPEFEALKNCWKDGITNTGIIRTVLRTASPSDVLYTYEGTITTPPCLPVPYIVDGTIGNVPWSFVEGIKSVIAQKHPDGNNRPPQPVVGRKAKMFMTVSSPMKQVFEDLRPPIPVDIENVRILTNILEDVGGSTVTYENRQLQAVAAVLGVICLLLVLVLAGLTVRRFTYTGDEKEPWRNPESGQKVFGTRSGDAVGSEEEVEDEEESEEAEEGSEDDDESG